MSLYPVIFSAGSLDLVELISNILSVGRKKERNYEPIQKLEYLGLTRFLVILALVSNAYH